MEERNYYGHDSVAEAFRKKSQSFPEVAQKGGDTSGHPPWVFVRAAAALGGRSPFPFMLEAARVGRTRGIVLRALGGGLEVSVAAAYFGLLCAPDAVSGDQLALYAVSFTLVFVFSLFSLPSLCFFFSPLYHFTGPFELLTVCVPSVFCFNHNAKHVAGSL